MAVTLVEKYNPEWPKRFEVVKASLGEKITGACIGIEHVGSVSILGMTAKAPALWVWLALQSTDGRFSNICFHLRPGMPVRITLQTKEPLSHAEIKKQLRVHSLIDTYR